MENRDPRDQSPQDYDAPFEPQNETPPVASPEVNNRYSTAAGGEGHTSPHQMRDDVPPRVQRVEQREEDGPRTSDNVRQFADDVKTKVQNLDLQQHFGPLITAWKRFFSSSTLNYTSVRLNTATNIFIAVFTILFTAVTLPLIQMKSLTATLGLGTLNDLLGSNLPGYPYGREFGVTLLYAVIMYGVLFALTYFGASLAKDPYNTPQVALERVNYSVFPFMTMLPLAFIFAFFAPTIASFLVIFGLLFSLLVYSYLWLRSTEQQRDRRFGILLGIVAVLLILIYLFFKVKVL